MLSLALIYTVIIFFNFLVLFLIKFFWKFSSPAKLVGKLLERIHFFVNIYLVYIKYWALYYIQAVLDLHNFVLTENQTYWNWVFAVCGSTDLSYQRTVQNEDLCCSSRDETEN